jgi:serine/threonine protein kinase
LYNFFMQEWLGKTIGKVRIDKYLAHGGMAEVYLGSHLSLDRPVAIKILHKHIEEDRNLLERFQREAKVVAGLRHPNIVQVFDFDATDGHPYIVMEYLKGPTLATYLSSIDEQGARLPLHQVARLLKALASALDYAHSQGVIHRDIKPGNVILHGKTDEIPLDRPLTNDVEIILTDFGLVRIEHAASKTATGLISGTPAYMSPEQARGDKTDHRTDIYSLGIVLYEMLAGRPPFEAKNTMALLHKQIHETPPPIAGISPAVQAVINRALAKKPADRYQTCDQMAVDFSLAIGMTAKTETIIETAPDHRTEHISSVSVKPKTANRGLIWIGVGSLLVLCLLVFAFGTFRVLSALPGSSKATQTPSPEITNPPLSPSPSESVGLPDTEGMVEIPSGTYEVGLTPADKYHTAPISIPLTNFWIDKYQTTNAQYQQYLNKTSEQPGEIWPGEGDHPARGVTWDQALAYCTWAGKRLPTEAEWEAAGRGPGSSPQLYPWGDDPTDGGKTFNLPDQDTYAVGTQSFNQSQFGVFDMVGNVWEWTGEPYAAVQNGYKVLHGGRFGLPQDLAYRLAVAPDDTRYVKFAGFRCATDRVK